MKKNEAQKRKSRRKIDETAGKKPNLVWQGKTVSREINAFFMSTP